MGSRRRMKETATKSTQHRDPPLNRLRIFYSWPVALGPDRKTQVYRKFPQKIMVRQGHNKALASFVMAHIMINTESISLSNLEMGRLLGDIQSHCRNDGHDFPGLWLVQHSRCCSRSANLYSFVRTQGCHWFTLGLLSGTMAPRCRTTAYFSEHCVPSTVEMQLRTSVHQSAQSSQFAL